MPNIRGVLDPGSAEAPDIWRCVSTPTPDNLPEDFVMGYDTDFERACEPDKLGWAYEQLSCGDRGTQPFHACSPVNGIGPPRPSWRSVCSTSGSVSPGICRDLPGCA